MIPAGADGGGRAAWQQGQLTLRYGAQVQPFPACGRQASAQRAIDMANFRVPLRLLHSAVQRGVEHRGGRAAVNEKKVCFFICTGFPFVRFQMPALR